MPSHRLAERTGFEPAEAVNLARFPSVCLKPLDHLSICGANLICSNIIPNVTQIVNTIQANFPTFSAILWQKQPILRNTSTAGRFCKFLCNAGQMQKELLHASNVLFQSLVAICHFVSCNGVMYDKKGTRSCRIPCWFYLFDEFWFGDV